MARLYHWANGDTSGPMLAEEGSIDWLRQQKLSHWTAQIKFDGMRCWAYIDWDKADKYPDEPHKGVVLRTRNGHDMSASFPDITEDLFEVLHYDADSFILDGEIIAHGPGAGHKLAHVQKRNNVTNPIKLEYVTAQFPATFVAFDIVGNPSLNNALSTGTFVERMNQLDLFKNWPDKITVVDTYWDLDRELEKIWHFVQSRGLEGLVAKRKDSYYRQQRNTAWRKIKY